MRRAAICFICSLPLYAAENTRTYYTGVSADLVLPYFWHTDSVYTYDSTVDWYRAVRYDFGLMAGASVAAGFEERVAGSHSFGIECGYSFVPAASQAIDTKQQVGATLVNIRETATLTHHTPRISARYVLEFAPRINLIGRIGIADRIVRRTIDPQPQNLPTGVTLTPGNNPARDDTYAVLTADLAGGIEYVADGRHGFSLMLVVNPPVVYPETVRNHIVLPYFATLSFGYRYLW